MKTYATVTGVNIRDNIVKNYISNDAMPIDIESLTYWIEYLNDIELLTEKSKDKTIYNDFYLISKNETSIAIEDIDIKNKMPKELQYSLEDYPYYYIEYGRYENNTSKIKYKIFIYIKYDENMTIYIIFKDYKFI